MSTKDDMNTLHSIIAKRIDMLNAVLNSHEGILNSLLRERGNIDSEMAEVESRRDSCAASIKELNDVLFSIDNIIDPPEEKS